MRDDLPTRLRRRTICRMDAPRQPTEGQRALAQELAHGRAAYSQGVTRLDTRRYHDADRFAAERRVLVGATPLPLVPSALLPEPGMAVAHDAYGPALIVSRDMAGAIHVFANSCRHRGTRLLDAAEPVTAKRLACPYHGWTYKVDGCLAGVARPDCFPGLDKTTLGLREYPSREAGGIVWFALDPDTDLGDADRLAEDFDALGLAGEQFYRRRTHTVAADWKLVVDAFLESYHVQRLHHASIAGFFADGIAVGDRLGPHQRFAVGRADYAARIDPTDWPQVRGAMTFTYHLFPNAILIASPDYVNILVVHPTALGRCTVSDTMLIPASADRADEKWEKSWALLDDGVFGAEDFRAAELCQQGIERGASEEMLLGRLEGAIADFHAELDARLQAGS